MGQCLSVDYQSHYVESKGPLSYAIAKVLQRSSSLEAAPRECVLLWMCKHEGGGNQAAELEVCANESLECQLPRCALFATRARTEM